MSNFDKTKPAGSTKLRLSDDQIRDNWDALQDAIARNHDFPTGYGADAGEHTVVDLQNQSGDPATPTGRLKLYAKTVTDKIRLFFKDAAGDVFNLLDHGNLEGLSDDDHPEYLRLDKESQTIAQDVAVADGIKIDGRDISADGAILDGTGKLKMLATAVNKITWDAATDWTDVDISANTGDDTAKAALLAVELDFIATDGGGACAMTGMCRKNGSSQTANLPRIRGRALWEHAIYSHEHFSACMLIVECDGSEIFETKLEASGTPSSVTYLVDLIGYFV
jgi:hypothetical protein